MARILCWKGVLNSVDADIGLLGKVIRHRHVGAWQNIEALDVGTPIAWEHPKVKQSKRLAGPRGRMLEWLGFLLGVFLLVLKVWLMCFRWFHFLKITTEVESYHSIISFHVYLGWLITWVDVGGQWLQIGISASFTVFGSYPIPQIGIKAWLTPQTGWAVCWSCIPVGCICVFCIIRPCAYLICMVLIMVVVMLPCEYWWCWCGMCHHECIVVYEFFIHVSVYMLLCKHFHGYGYACIVGQTCIVRSLYVIRSSWWYVYVMMLMSWLR